MAAPDTRFHSAEMVRALLREDRAWPRYETLYGELAVTPAPRGLHQWLALEVAGELRSYLQRWPVGTAYVSPADISWGRTDVLVQPDVFVVPRDQARRAHRGESWRAVRHLLLAVELVSPESAHRDRFAKRVLYQRQGVDAYWVLDAEERVAEGWTPAADAPQVERERITWLPDGAGEPFVFDFAARLAAELDG